MAKDKPRTKSVKYDKDAMTSAAVEASKHKCPSCGADIMVPPDSE